VASVSCIYGLGNVSDYTAMTIDLKIGERPPAADKLLRQLSDIQYQRNDMEFTPAASSGCAAMWWRFFPIGEEVAYRLEFFGDELERIAPGGPAHRRGAGRAPGAEDFPG